MIWSCLWCFGAPFKGFNLCMDGNLGQLPKGPGRVIIIIIIIIIPVIIIIIIIVIVIIITSTFMINF